MKSTKDIQRAAKTRREKENIRRREIREALGGDHDEATTSQVEGIENARAELASGGPDLIAGVMVDEENEAMVHDEAMEESLGETQLGSVKFMKLRDALPPCPPRGMFDVERIRDSAYFFS